MECGIRHKGHIRAFPSFAVFQGPYGWSRSNWFNFKVGVSEGLTAKRPGNRRQDQVLVLFSRSISYAIPIDQNVQISNTIKLLQKLLI